MVAEGCNPSEELGINFFFNITILSDDTVEVADMVLRQWNESDNTKQV